MPSSDCILGTLFRRVDQGFTFTIWREENKLERCRVFCCLGGHTDSRIVLRPFRADDPVSGLIDLLVAAVACVDSPCAIHLFCRPGKDQSVITVGPVEALNTGRR